MSARKRILVVDDDELLRQFYCRVLAAQGYTPVAAANGDEAITILQTDADGYQLAVVDLLLPVRSGWELISFLRNSPEFREIPIMAITGLSFSYEEFDKIKAACDAVLLKGDFEIAKFNDTVAALLARPQDTVPCSRPS